MYRNVVVMGTRDGYIVQMDDSLNNDWDGQASSGAGAEVAINSYATLSLYRADSLDEEGLIERIMVQMGEGTSNTTLTVHGSDTTEKVFDSALRQRLVEPRTVAAGVTVVVAAGSVVTRDVPPDTLVGGNPAAVIRSTASARFSAEPFLTMSSSSGISESAAAMISRSQWRGGSTLAVAAPPRSAGL